MTLDIESASKQLWDHLSIEKRKDLLLNDIVMTSIVFNHPISSVEADMISEKIWDALPQKAKNDIMLWYDMS